MRIKAQGLLNAHAWLVETHGAAFAERVVARCSGAVAHRLRTAIALDWHPVEELVELVAEAELELGDFSGAVAVEIGAAGARANLKSPILRLLVFAGQREFVAKRIAALWRQYNDEGEMELGFVDAGTLRLEVAGVPDPHPHFCGVITGWLREVAHALGAKNGVAVHTQCVARGAARCRWDVGNVEALLTPVGETDAAERAPLAATSEPPRAPRPSMRARVTTPAPAEIVVDRRATSIHDPVFDLPARPPFPIGAAPFRVRGAAYTEDMRELARRCALDEVLERVDPAVRAFVLQRFQPTAWYDVQPLTYLTAAAAQARGIAFEQYVREKARREAELVASRAPALAIGAPDEALAQWLPRAASFADDLGALEARVVEPGRLRGVRRGVPRFLVRATAIAATAQVETILHRWGLRPRVHALEPTPDGHCVGHPLLRVAIDVAWSDGASLERPSDRP